MKFSKISLVANIIFKTKSPKIFIAIFSIIVLVLSLSIGAYFFTGNLLNSYSNMLQKSYLGFEPRFTLKSTNVEFLQSVESLLQQNNLTSSMRKVKKSSYTLKLNKRDIKKKITFYIYKDNYLNKRFGGEQSVYVNNIFNNILKDTKNIDIQTEDDKKLFIKDFAVVDTGFLSSEAIIFIESTKIKGFIDKNKLHSILEIDDQLDETIKMQISKIAMSLQVLNYKYIDRLKSEQDAYDNLYLFEIAKNLFLIILIGTVIVIILVTQNILIELKEKSLNIILKMGMGLREVLIVFIFISTALFLLASLLAQIILEIFRSYYLKISDFKDDFFINMIFSDYIVLIYSILILIIFTIILNIIILKGTMK